MVGEFKTTLKNFSKTTNKALSMIAGSGLVVRLLDSMMFNPETVGLVLLLVATLCFLKRAAEKPDAQTCTAYESWT